MWVRGDEAIGTPLYTFHLQVSLLCPFPIPEMFYPTPSQSAKLHTLFSGLKI